MSELTTLAEELKKGRSVVTTTKGISMQPLLKENETSVVIAPICKPLRIGDCPLVFLKDDLYQLHRIIKIDDEYYYTRGDNCFASEKILKERALGVVTQIYRKGKYISVTDFGYRLYVFFWTFSYPVRRVYRSIKARLK